MNLFETLRNEWAVIKATPWSFIGAVAVVGAAAYAVSSYRFTVQIEHLQAANTELQSAKSGLESANAVSKSTIESKEATIEQQDHLLNSYRQKEQVNSGAAGHTTTMASRHRASIPVARAQESASPSSAPSIPPAVEPAVVVPTTEPQSRIDPSNSCPPGSAFCFEGDIRNTRVEHLRGAVPDGRTCLHVSGGTDNKFSDADCTVGNGPANAGKRSEDAK